MNLTTFQKELAQPTLNLPRLALLYAQNIAYPALSIERYVCQLEQLAELCRPRMTGLDPAEQALAIAQFLFEEEGFQGNITDYQNPSNSYLNDVLDYRLGIPITLSVVFLTVAQKLNLRVYGIGLPGHFLVGIPTGQTPLFLDPFHTGRVVSDQDCVRLIRQATGYSLPLQSHWLEPVSSREILLRMLNNLRLAYAQQEQWALAWRAVAHLRLVAPTRPEFVRDEGLLLYQLGQYRQATTCLEQYLQHLPNAPDRQAIRQHIGRGLESWVKLN